MRLLTVISTLLTVVALTATAADSPQTRAISLDDCMAEALKNNLELQIVRYNPQLSLLAVNAAQAGYEPTFTFTGQHEWEDAEGPDKWKLNQFSSGLGGVAPWGMTYSLNARTARRYGDGLDNNNAPFSFDYYTTSGGLDITQPLLKNLWIDSTRLAIAVARNQMKQTELSFKSSMIGIVTRVELAYYDLQFGHETVKVQQKGLELAQRLLDENRKRVEVGAMAPLDEKQAEAEVAARRADLIAAQYALSTLENALKHLVSDDFAGWNTKTLVPTDSLNAERQLTDLQDSWSKGLTLRPDYLQLKMDLERQGIQLKYDRNQLYPQLDAFASVRYASTDAQFGGSFTGVRNFDNPYYLIGGSLTIPLGNGAARSRHEATKTGMEQSLLGLKQLEQQIMVGIDNAIKLVQSNYERTAATRQAREYAEAALAAEQKKLENGKSTSFVVLQLQRDLTAARSVEISALVQHKRSIALLAEAEGTTLERRKIDLIVR